MKIDTSEAMIVHTGTSPLYLWPSVFSSSPSEEDVVGALSLVLWTLTLIVVVKYVVRFLTIVLSSKDSLIVSPK